MRFQKGKEVFFQKKTSGGIIVILMSPEVISRQFTDLTLLLCVAESGFFADGVALGEGDVVTLFAVAVGAEVAQGHAFPAVDDGASAFGDLKLAACKLARE